ncbi:hypothetical protein GEMRC1_011088 [Eukaryota sp. GEM-RC1]
MLLAEPPCKRERSKDAQDYPRLLSPTKPSPKIIFLQESLLFLVNSHLHTHCLKSFLRSNDNRSHGCDFRLLINSLYSFFENFGCTNIRFFKSSLYVTKVFFQTTTFYVCDHDLTKPCSLASLFDAPNPCIGLVCIYECSEQTIQIVIMSSTLAILSLTRSSPLFLPCLKRLEVTRSDDDYSLLFRYLAVHSTVVDFVITIRKWKPSEVEELAEMFSANSTLKKVNLNGDYGVKDLNVERLFHGLSRNKSIIKLDLSLFPICDSVYFSILLRNNTIRTLVYPDHLKTLDSTVISSLNRNSALQELFLISLNLS